ncbi:presenilin family intramembrane aspartyl protease [Bacteroidota bacterium]
MKHNVNVTAIIISFFLLTQILGLYLVSLDSEVTTVDGKIVVDSKSADDVPELMWWEVVLMVMILVLIGTGLVLLIMKFRLKKVWKGWFFLAVLIAMGWALQVVVSAWIAFGLAFILAALKLWKRNIIIHNFTEVLMYSGLAIILTPWFGESIIAAFAVLIAISVYDMIAVWKTKHMIEMAKFQTENKLFAGLMIPYDKEKGIHLQVPPKPNGKDIKKKIKNAILGGGDVAFPLIFTAVVMRNLMKNGVAQSTAFFQATVISFAVTISLLGLFVFAKKKRFYPAMPVVTAGCFIGYLIVLLF